MFTSLKNKIKEETGGELMPHQRLGYNNNQIRNHIADGYSPKGDELSALRSKCEELEQRLTFLQDEKCNIEKTNEILLESVKVAQAQKDLYFDEKEKIHNSQQSEIDKLKNLLSFREQEAVDQLTKLSQKQQLCDSLTSEVERLRLFEVKNEELKDELETQRHSTEHEKINLSTELALVKEENDHLRKKIEIMEQARINALDSLKADEKVKALVEEHKLLMLHLEEAHLQLSDIKSSWSGQNLALETQVRRLSKQVAEETTEKRKALKLNNDLSEKLKKMEFEMYKIQNEIQQRDAKVKLLQEEVDDLSLTLKQCREECEQQTLFERSKADSLGRENKDLKVQIENIEIHFNDKLINTERIEQSLQDQVKELQKQISELHNEIEFEKSEKLAALLKNAEISQSSDILNKKYHLEKTAKDELITKYNNLQNRFDKMNDELNSVIAKSKNHAKEAEEMRLEIFEQNKAIRILNQNITDYKNELRSSESFNLKSEVSQNEKVHKAGFIIMDEINFKYLKHVIVKFLTSREVEAKHLIRIVSKLLSLTKEEEKLLQDTLNWKTSWFGPKPNHGKGQHAFSILPS